MRAWFIASALLALGACGGGKSAEGKCEDLLEVVCERAVECVGGGTAEECYDAIRPQFPCGNADRVSDSYDACMDQLDTLSCGVLFPPDANGNPSLVLPADCNMVIIDEG